MTIRAVKAGRVALLRREEDAGSRRHRPPRGGPRGVPDGARAGRCGRDPSIVPIGPDGLGDGAQPRARGMRRGGARARRGRRDRGAGLARGAGRDVGERRRGARLRRGSAARRVSRRAPGLAVGRSRRRLRHAGPRRRGRSPSTPASGPSTAATSPSVRARCGRSAASGPPADTATGATGSARSTRLSASWRARAGARRTCPRRRRCGSSTATRRRRVVLRRRLRYGARRTLIGERRTGARAAAGSSRRARRGCRSRSLAGSRRLRWSGRSEPRRAPGRCWAPDLPTPTCNRSPERPRSGGACRLRSRGPRGVVARGIRRRPAHPALPPRRRA